MKDLILIKRGADETESRAAGLGSGTGLAMFVFVKSLILYANEFIIDKKRDAAYGLCRHNYWNSFLLVCKNSRFYN